MAPNFSTRFITRLCFSQMAVLVSVIMALSGSLAVGQTDRQKYLDRQPLAEIDVQPLTTQPQEMYARDNQVMLYRPEEENPLSFYSRTQDGEWLIPSRVQRDDPWVRLLVLSPAGPVIVDVAIEINQQSYRAAREGWIDRLLKEAKATFLVRTGVETAEAAGITEPEPEKSETEEKVTAEGTPESAEASEVNADTESETDDEAAEGETEETSEEEVPTVAAQGRQTRTVFQRLINYLAADQEIADREEVRWLLAEWTGGPALLTLSPAFAWRRADLAPLWRALDRDDDQALSSDEIQRAASTLKQADINRDDSIDLGELQRLAKDHSNYQRTNSHPLVVVIDENTDWKSLRKDIRLAYPAQQGADVDRGKGTTDMSLQDRMRNGDRSLSTAVLANLLSLSPDLVYRISFGKEQAKVTLLAVTGTTTFNSSSEQVITVEIRGPQQQETYLELSAAQGEIDVENASGDMQQTQVAIGAVVDGYPLFRQLDLDNNHQLTLRERRKVGKFLATLDRNANGQVEHRELPTPIRLAVTLGPQVHKYLGKATSAQRKVGEQTVAEVPAWFLGMDRNHDGDLSRREFKGNPSQFARFDRDGDGLISRKEAQEMAAADE